MRKCLFVDWAKNVIDSGKIQDCYRSQNVQGKSQRIITYLGKPGNKWNVSTTDSIPSKTGRNISGHLWSRCFYQSEMNTRWKGRLSMEAGGRQGNFVFIREKSPGNIIVWEFGKVLCCSCRMGRDHILSIGLKLACNWGFCGKSFKIQITLVSFY